MKDNHNIQIINESFNNENENIFWVVFKNKYLFNKILNLTNIKIGIESFKYDDITSVKWMLDNNYIELLKDKIKRNQELSFSYSNDYSLDYSYSTLLIELKKEFKKEPQTTKEILKLLFKNYFINQCKMNNQILISNILESKFSNALELLFNEPLFKNNNMIYKPTLNDLYESIKYLSVKCTKLILNYLNNDIIQEIEEIKIWSSLTENKWCFDQEISATKIIPRFKIVNYLLSINLLKSPIQPIELLITKFSTSTYHILAMFCFGPTEIAKFTIKNLIESCYYIYNYQKFKNENKQEQQQQIINDIKEIDEILLKFKKHELKSYLSDYLENEKQQGSQNKDIKRMYEIYLEFKEYQLFEIFHLEFKRLSFNIIYDLDFKNEIDRVVVANNNNNNNERSSCVERNIKFYTVRAFMNGSLNFFKSLNYYNHKSTGNFIKGNDIYNEIIKEFKDSLHPDILFEEINKNDLEKQIYFLNGMVELIKENSLFSNLKQTLTILLINYDNIELVKYYLNLLIKNYLCTMMHKDQEIRSVVLESILPTTQDDDDYDINRFIKSTEMLGFILENFKTQILPLKRSDLFINLGRIDLLEFLELNLSDNEFKEYIVLPTKPSTPFRSLIFKSICYMFKRIEKYNFIINQDIIQDLISNKIKESNSIYSFKDLKYLIENSKISIEPISLFSYYPYFFSYEHQFIYKDYSLIKDFNPKLIKLLNLIYSQDNHQDRFKFLEYEYSNSLYLTGRIDQLFNNESFLNLHVFNKISNTVIDYNYDIELYNKELYNKELIFLLIGSRGDIYSFEKLINLLKSSNSNNSNNSNSKFIKQRKREILYLILFYQIKYGKLNLFKYLHKNHNEILLLKNNASWLTKECFDQLKKTIIIYNHNHILKFFKNELNI